MTAFSTLQRTILTTCFTAPRQRVTKDELDALARRQGTAKPRDVQGTVTRSIERLIERGFVTVHGTKTPKKLFIQEVRLTPSGRRHARQLFGKQQRLPLSTR